MMIKIIINLKLFARACWHAFGGGQPFLVKRQSLNGKLYRLTDRTLTDTAQQRSAINNGTSWNDH